MIEEGGDFRVPASRERGDVCMIINLCVIIMSSGIRKERGGKRERRDGARNAGKSAEGESRPAEPGGNGSRLLNRPTPGNDVCVSKRNS